MAKSADALRSAEQLKEVAIFLKQADKLVKEGNYAAALDEIAKARSRDPRNLYALAYEERVRSLVTAQKDKKPEITGIAPAQPIPAALEHISNLAIVEAQRSAAVAAKQEQEAELRRKEEDERRKNEELRRQAIETKIVTFLNRSKDYLDKGDFNRALDEVARAYLLDPANEKIHESENLIRRTQEEARLRDEQDRIKKQQEDEKKRQELLKAQVARLQQEKEEKRRKEEEARKQAQQQKISQYLTRAQEFLNDGRLDEALSELAFVVVIDPLNEEVLSLERQIRDAQEREQAEQLEQLRKREDEQRKKREAIFTAIQKHIENAERLASQQKWSEALRVITRAYVLDPVNEALQACERRIQLAQEDALRIADEQRRIAEETVRRQQEEELRKLEQSERERAVLGENAETEAKRRADKEKVFQYLTKARSYLLDERFEDALGEVALAFIVNPFDEDVKRMEQDIISAQNKKKAQEAVTLTEESTTTTQTDETAEKISFHLAEASRYASDNEFSKALDEVAKAFILDPLSEAIQNFEAQLQKEFHAYQDELHKKQEEESRQNAINNHYKRATEFLEREAFDEALAEVADGFTYDTENIQLKKLEQRIQDSYQQWQIRQAEEEKNSQIEDLIFKSKEYLAKESYEDALMTITKAIVLDPNRESLKAMETEIENEQEAFEKRKHTEEGNKIIQKHLFRAKECKVLRSYDEALAEIEQALIVDPSREDLLQFKNQIQQEFSDWKAQKDQNAKQASLKQHLRQAREHLTNKVYDEALMEVAMGMTIDPDNADLKALEEDIVKAQADAEIEAAELEGAAESNLKDEERDQLIWIHLRAADELQKQKEFAQALDELAKAYVIDPLNKELKKAEIRIRQNEIRHAQQTGQTLKLIYPNEKAIGGS
jgi:tetratricopeptide (TPR) repeat protein